MARWEHHLPMAQLEYCMAPYGPESRRRCVVRAGSRRLEALAVVVALRALVCGARSVC